MIPSSDLLAAIFRSSRSDLIFRNSHFTSSPGSSPCNSFFLTASPIPPNFDSLLCFSWCKPSRPWFPRTLWPSHLQISLVLWPLPPLNWPISTSERHWHPGKAKDYMFSAWKSFLSLRKHTLVFLTLSINEETPPSWLHCGSLCQVESSMFTFLHTLQRGQELSLAMRRDAVLNPQSLLNNQIPWQAE